MSSDRQTLDVAINVFLNEMSTTISIKSSLWKESLRVLVVNPRPTLALKSFHARMRAAVARSRYDEPFVDLLLQAVDAAENAFSLAELLAPIRLALISFAGAISRRPSAQMAVVRKLIEGSSLEEPGQLSFSTLANYGHTLPISQADAMSAVSFSVDRAIRASLDEQGRAVGAFSSWDHRERLAGMEAIWLAYTYCGVGVARCGSLDTVALQRDLDRAGISLWNGLDAAMEDSTSKEPQSTRSDRHEALLMLRANVYQVDLMSRIPLLPSQAAGKSAETSLPTTGLLHVVCRSAIPKSSDRQDIVEIDRHRVLEKPLPATPMPTILNLQAAFDRVLAEFPWAASAIHAIFDDLLGRASLGVRLLTLPATLLIGHPGAGKSRLARRIAEELELTRLDVSLGGNGDTKQLSGTSRGWSGGRPSDLASLLARRRTASALVTLDEIDKARDGGHREGGGIAAYLLPLLEPETACRHYDNFLKAECDFSLVSWLATGNTLSGIPKALQSRLRILLVPQPRRQDFPVVCAGVIKDLEKRWQLPAGTLPSAQEIGMDVRGLSSARQARVATEAAVSAWARAIIRQ